MRNRFFPGAVAVFGLIFVLDCSVHGGREPAKIKIIMQKAMNGGKNSLYNKVVGGNGSADEKKMLFTLLSDLGANKCPKGDEEAWKTRTKAIADAVKADDLKAIAKAVDCQTCHKEHKGK